MVLEQNREAGGKGIEAKVDSPLPSPLILVEMVPTVGAAPLRDPKRTPR